MKLRELIPTLDAKCVAGDCDAIVTGVTHDSRAVKNGYVFVAVPGLSKDGWMFETEAVQRGAVAVVSEHKSEPRGKVCYVQVEDAQEALSQAAAEFHGRPANKLNMIGVTGTNGKTTVVYMAGDILRAAGRKPGIIGTIEYVVGERNIPAARTTPEAPLLQSLLSEMVSRGCDSVAMEVSSHALDQKRTGGIDFDVRVFTNLTRDHLDYHKTIEDYFATKQKLFLAGSSKRACAVINKDDEWGRKLLGKNLIGTDILAYGLREDADVRALNVEINPGGSSFDAQTPWGNSRVSLGIPGRFNVSNALAAMASCGVLGVDVDTMVKGLANLRPVRGRLEEVPTATPFKVFVDYAHTDDALKNVLTTLRELTRNRLILVFGCGGDRDRQKRPAMAEVASELADCTFITSDNPRTEDPASILKEIEAGFHDGAKYRVIEDRAQAIGAAVAEAGEGDVLIIAGKGHESFQEFGNKTIPFDDRQVVLKATQEKPKERA